MTFLNENSIPLTTLMSIIEPVVIFVIAVIALFVFWHLQQSFTINISPKIRVLNWSYRILKLAFTIKNNARVRIRKPVTTLTVLYYKKDFFNYLIRSGIRDLEEFVPIGVENKNELVGLIDVFLKIRHDIEYSCCLKGKIRERNYIKELLMETFKQEIYLKSGTKSCLIRKIRRRKYIKKLTDHYKRVEIFLDQFFHNNIEEFSKLKEYIVEVKSSRLLKTTENIYPKETIKIERLITFRKDIFVHIGLHIKSRGLFRVTSRTLTAFYGLD